MRVHERRYPRKTLLLNLFRANKVFGSHRLQGLRVGVVCSGGNSSIEHLELALAYRGDDRLGDTREPRDCPAPLHSRH